MIMIFVVSNLSVIQIIDKVLQNFHYLFSLRDFEGAIIRTCNDHLSSCVDREFTWFTVLVLRWIVRTLLLHITNNIIAIHHINFGFFSRNYYWVSHFLVRHHILILLCFFELLPILPKKRPHFVELLIVGQDKIQIRFFIFQLKIENLVLLGGGGGDMHLILIVLNWLF